MDSRDYRVLKHFFNENYLKLNELSYLENVSQKSMQKYIDNLNNSLKSVAEIKKNNDVYFLEIYDFDRFSKIQSGYLKEELDYNDLSKRKACIIKVLVEINEKIYPENLMSILMVSRSTLIRDLNSLKHDIRRYGLDIRVSKTTGISLVIKENYQLVLAINSLVYDYYFSDFLLSDSLLSFIKQKNEKKIVNKKEEELFCRILGIVIYLKEYGYTLYNNNKYYHNQLKDNCYIKDIISKASEEYNIVFNDVEYDFICFPFNLRKTDLYDIQKNERVLFAHSKKIYPIIWKIIEYFNIEIEAENFYKLLKNHLLDLVVRSIFLIETTDLFNNKIVDSFPISSEMSILLKSELEESYGLVIENNEINYLTLYCQQIINSLKDKHYDNKWTILFLGTISLSIKEYIISKIREDIGNNINFKTINNIKKIEGNFDQVIFIFSDTLFDCKKVPVPVIPIKNIIKTTEIDTYIKIGILNKMINEEACKYSISKVKGNSYIDVMYRMINNEINKSVFGHSFINSWLEKEKSGTLLIENEVAIPHVVDESIENGITLSIALLDNTICAYQKNVRVIMLIGIPKKLDYQTTRTLNEVYDFCINASKNQNILDKLINYDSRKTITQLIEGL